jgi:Flp pilus assembly pilin Flp
VDNFNKNQEPEKIDFYNQEANSTSDSNRNLSLGASFVEYAFLMILIVLICVAAVRSVGIEVSSGFSQVGEAFKP